MVGTPLASGACSGHSRELREQAKAQATQWGSTLSIPEPRPLPPNTHSCTAGRSCCLAELADLVWLPSARVTPAQEQARASVFLGKGVSGHRTVPGHQGAVKSKQLLSFWDNWSPL